MWAIDKERNQMKPLLSYEGITEAYNAPRQSLPDVYWQTGHIDAIRCETIMVKKSMSGAVMVPLEIDSKYTVDIDSMLDWHQAEWLVQNGNLDMVDPANQRRPLPINAQTLILDFDGVLTDNRVWTDEEGHEWVASNRSDSLGLSVLRKNTAIKIIVLSRETSPVVAARCKKLDIPVFQGRLDKAETLRSMQSSGDIELANTIYMGNDINDLPCFPLVACAIAPADSHPEVIRRADIYLEKNGGHGAVREICDMLLSRYKHV